MDRRITDKERIYLEGIGVLKRDPGMRRIINTLGEITIKPHGASMFEALVHSVISQQISTGAATTIRGRFIEMYPRKGFPTTLDVMNSSTQELRKSGLSNAKATYIQELAKSDINGSVPTLEDCALLDDSQIIERLTQLKGIGLWSAQMVLIFNLNRPDVFPATDGGIVKALGLIYFDGVVPTTNEALDCSIRWQPYRSLASHYLWRALAAGIV